MAFTVMGRLVTPSVTMTVAGGVKSGESSTLPMLTVEPLMLAEIRELLEETTL